MSEHRIFFIFDLCDDIAQLDTFLVSLPAAQTPTWVGLGGEEAETNGFWNPKFSRNASFNRTSWIRVEICKIPLDSLFIPECFPWPAAPPCRARLALVNIIEGSGIPVLSYPP